MSRTSQSLAFTIDELIRNRWVSWSEDVLNTRPDSSFNSKRGFQEIVGVQNGTERSRATEIFRLGLIKGRLIGEKKGRTSSVPAGWKNICEDNSIHTHTGYIAYVIGKGLNCKPSPGVTVLEAFDSLCTLLILSIGFMFDNRWYSTVNIFLFVKNRAEESFARTLTNQELRLLAGAVFNTLDYKYAEQLIRAYETNGTFKLHYLFRSTSGAKAPFDESNIELFEIGELEQVTSSRKFDLELTYRQKASLFWAVANSGRGIFTRAFRAGEEFLTALTQTDQKLASNKQRNLLHDFYVDRENGFIHNDLLSVTLNLTDDFPELKKGLTTVMKTLNEGVVESLHLIKKKTEIQITEKFYLHEQIDVPEELSQFSISVPKKGLPVEPTAGNVLVQLNGKEFTIQKVKKEDERFIITLEK
ncbi:hypothetical protein RJ44_19885 [Alteromonas macleodii]|uniref:hypothetical protein n=1 Tax=Alteromonas macleodii TaxID=28108 RepID=UPI00057C950D|nr:hypothetical protein [Alteromonas macleodii]KHT53261.1 hypothetical protein RJ44_19885 [Alteromonas macleodii]